MLSLLGVLLAAVLLGAAVWVVGIAILAWVLTRPVLAGGTLLAAGAAVAATGVVYVLAVVVIRLLLPA